MNRIRELRLQNGMKQTELARRMNCSPTTISSYETNYREIDAPTIRKLCEIFGCTADYLLGLSALPAPELTPEEESLLAAWRRCDNRAKDVVLVALAPFASGQSQSETG